MLGDMDYEALNARVEMKLARRKKQLRYAMFGVSILMFVIFAVLGWMIAAGSISMDSINSSFDDAATTGLFMVTMGGFMSIMMNTIGMMMDSNIGDKQLRSQVLMEELGTDLQQLAQGKAKRRESDGSAAQRLADDADANRYVELSDDGEIVPVGEAELRSRRSMGSQ